MYFAFGVALLLALNAVRWTSKTLFQHELVEFDGSFDPDQTPCFNKSMVDSIISSPLSRELKKALLEYSRTHAPYLRRLTLNSQWWEFRNSDDFDDPSERYRWWLSCPEHFSPYVGNILATLDSEDKVVFFPAAFSLNRFEQTVHPDKVTVKFSPSSIIADQL